jgi:hypothetical protein
MTNLCYFPFPDNWILNCQDCINVLKANESIHTSEELKKALNDLRKKQRDDKIQVMFIDHITSVWKTGVEKRMANLYRTIGDEDEANRCLADHCEMVRAVRGPNEEDQKTYDAGAAAHLAGLGLTDDK